MRHIQFNFLTKPESPVPGTESRGFLIKLSIKLKTGLYKFSFTYTLVKIFIILI